MAKSYNKTKMSCVICNKVSKPWLLLKNENIYTDEENKPIGQTIQTCGYSCCRKLDPMLPKNYGKLILNKVDFCYWAVPIVPQKTKSFEVHLFVNPLYLSTSLWCVRFGLKLVKTKIQNIIEIKIIFLELK